MERRNGHGAHEAPGSGWARRVAIVVALIALVAVAFVGGYLLAQAGDDEAAPSPSASLSHA